MSFYAVIIAKTAIINYHKYKSGYIEEDCMMRIRKQAFITPSYSIDQDFRIFYYSDIRSSHLHPHVHDFFEMYLLVSGKIMYKTCGIDFFLQPGDILFLNRGQLHCTVLLEPSTPYERITLHVSPDTLMELSTDEVNLAECFTREKFMVYHYPQEVQNNIQLILNKLFSISPGSQFGYKLLGRACLTELFVEINKYNHDRSIHSFNKETKDIQLVELVRQYILEHIEEDITIRALADYFYMSEYHFMHVFKHASGISAHQQILKLRLQIADSLIQNGASLSRVSQQCGFCDYSSFYRAFLRERGVSPQKFYKNEPVVPSAD